MYKIYFAIGNAGLEKFIKTHKKVMEHYLHTEVQFVGETVYREGIVSGIKDFHPDLVIINEGLSGKADIKDIICGIRMHYPDVRILFMAGDREVGDSLLAIIAQYGVYDLIIGTQIDAKEVVKKIIVPSTLSDVAHLIPKLTVDEKTKNKVFEAPDVIFNANTKGDNIFGDTQTDEIGVTPMRNTREMLSKISEEDQKKRALEEQKELEERRQRELDEQRQRVLDKQREVELEEERTRELEEQRERELEEKRQADSERQRQMELDEQKQKEKEERKQRDLEEREQRDLERKQRELEKQRERESEEQRRKELDELRQRDLDRQREREAEEQRRRELDELRQRERELDEQRQINLEGQREREKNSRVEPIKIIKPIQPIVEERPQSTQQQYNNYDAPKRSDRDISRTVKIKPEKEKPTGLFGGLFGSTNKSSKNVRVGQQIITFIGGHTGVGNSQIAFNTALSLTSKGHSVMYMDLNDRFSAIDCIFQLGYSDVGIDTAIHGIINEDYNLIDRSIVNMNKILPNVSADNYLYNTYSKTPTNIDMLFFSQDYMTREEDNEYEIDKSKIKDLMMYLMMKKGYDFIIIDAPCNIYDKITTTSLIYTSKIFFTVTQDIAVLTNHINNIKILNKKRINFKEKFYYLLNKYENVGFKIKDVYELLSESIRIDNFDMVSVPNISKDLIVANYLGEPILWNTKAKEFIKSISDIEKLILK